MFVLGIEQRSFNTYMLIPHVTHSCNVCAAAGNWSIQWIQIPIAIAILNQSAYPFYKVRKLNVLEQQVGYLHPGCTMGNHSPLGWGMGSGCQCQQGRLQISEELWGE